MNEYARRMMMNSRQPQHPYGEMPQHPMMGGSEHEGGYGGNKYFIYRDGRMDGNDMRDGRRDYADSAPYDMNYDGRRDMAYHGSGRDVMYGKRDIPDGNYGRDYASGYGDRYSEKPYGRPDYGYASMEDERDRQRDYGYADYHSARLNKKDIKKWEKHLENADGTMGKKYSKDQIMPAAQQLGIKFNEYSEDDFAMAVNMLYSDYCKAIGGDMMLYIKLAKAFLEDDDFDGTGSEKLALYYRCIAEPEDKER